MRILVCGGRDFTDGGFLFTTLSQFLKDNDLAPADCTIIQGGARGADSIAHLWASTKGIGTETYTANWDKYGPRAGPIRNKQMLDEGNPDVVIAFPGGRGTANMIQQAEDANIPIYQPKPPE